MNECAWCLVEQGLPLGEGSHGICPTHEAEQWQKYLDRKSEREQQESEQVEVVAA